MDRDLNRDQAHRLQPRGVRGWRLTALAALGWGSATLGLAGARAQQGMAPTPLAFDGVTVVDVEHGQLITGQRVVIMGPRIQRVGPEASVPVPSGARVVEAQGKYLIPGLWDMHTHAARSAEVFYPLFLANGVTGIRDAGSPVPLDTLRRWRQEILAGTRVGPPRQLLAGQSITAKEPPCDRSAPQLKDDLQTCVTSAAGARQYVDSLKAAGADLLTLRELTRAMYFVIAAEARRQGVPFGGDFDEVAALEAADSGAQLLDHVAPSTGPGGGLFRACWVRRPMDSAARPSASLAQCQPIAERFKQRGTWLVPTLLTWQAGPEPGVSALARYFRDQAMTAFWADSASPGNWLRDASHDRDTTRESPPPPPPMDESLHGLYLLRRVGLPLLAGTDVSGATGGRKWSRLELPGFALHAELAIYQTEGLSPVEALQTATLNPAQFLHATDSLGTVAEGKLADLVLLDANPLEDVANTTQIRAVVANGRYFDRVALDQLLAAAKAAGRTLTDPPPR